MATIGKTDYTPLVRLLRTPTLLSGLTAEELSHVIDLAYLARLSGWLLGNIDVRVDVSRLPPWLSNRVLAMRLTVTEWDRSLRWEIDRVTRALSDVDMTAVLLKGGAYLAAGLPPGSGRRVADLDIMVPEARLADAERALLAHGWQYQVLTDYDAMYYRQWMHELPPLQHTERKSILDLHHAILPKTSRLHPDPARLLAHAVTTSSGSRVLSPAHMVLHAAAHLFHDGEIAGAIRDLVDLDGLLRHFSTDAEFWPTLIREAQVLQLTRPAFYAIHHARKMLNTPIPAEALHQIEAWAPPKPVGWLMDGLIERAVQGEDRPSASFSAFALYARSHWLKMPPFMLGRHLFRKAFLS